MDKRARIPSQKALMAKEISTSYGIAQRGQKSSNSSKELARKTQPSPKTNETVTLNRETEKSQRIWSEVLQASPSEDQAAPTSSGKKSWADEVEEEMETQKKQGSIWDDFDIAKISNAGYKLEYVEPKTHVSLQLFQTSNG
ncbi:uncharacterized protein LOC142170687 [Nicotiana tabacum]|uniref:Uncharacterized protein LOC142170687 n=2 Tax=Nicotiana TaxID=4085 RepID=A0AC58SVA0_TOBAC|nr:PREDICTED: uncharacterized protein LOC104237544 isoform X2 [Nicotiana sylvestris]